MATIEARREREKPESMVQIACSLGVFDSAPNLSAKERHVRSWALRHADPSTPIQIDEETEAIMVDLGLTRLQIATTLKMAYHLGTYWNMREEPNRLARSQAMVKAERILAEAAETNKTDLPTAEH